MPEFLENSNSYHLGIKQDGEPLGDVGLPPWAKVIHYFVCVSIIILLNNTDNIQLALVHGTIQYWTYSFIHILLMQNYSVFVPDSSLVMSSSSYITTFSCKNSVSKRILSNELFLVCNDFA